MAYLSFFIFLLLKSLLGANAFENLCPAIEDLEPCGCVSDGRSIRVDCMSVTDINELKTALQSVKGIHGVFIDFIRARIDYIPSDLFKGLHVTKISFTNCELKKFGDEGRSALEGLENIIEEFSVHFSFNEDNNLKYLNVSQLKSLTDLQIEGNELTEMGNDWFKDGPVNVRNLFVMTNFIEKLGDKVFASFHNVRNLWLTGNKFKTVKRSMFPTPALHLTSLDLTNNEISILPEDIFSKMPSLKEVILAENSIQHITETTWSSVWSRLRSAYLETNPLICDSGIEWMFEVSRPLVLKGTCVGPNNRREVALKKIIDDKQEEDLQDD